MKKVLIVDDSKTNRMTLNFMLNDWCEDHDTELDLFEAEDGQIAVDMFKEEAFDLIFMDIMMPNLNGIEATKKIREISKKDAMIIAVSALDDNESKNKILQAGAEDYITKPVNEDIFKKRINHYLSLVDSRKHKKFNAEAINIINNEIFSRRLTFIIKDMTTLSEFWDYYLLEDTKYSDKLTDLVRVIYGLGLLQIKLKFNFEITIEESDNSIFFTMNNIKLLNSELVERIISKNYLSGDYKVSGDKVTFEFKKVIKEVVVTKNVEQEEEVVVKESVSEDPSNIEVVKTEEELQIFDFLDRDDIEELERFANELNSLMMLIGSSELQDEEVLQISSYIASFSRVLTTYNETYNISDALAKLSEDIEANIETFQEKSKDIALLCQAFNRDLLLWIQKLFYDGAPSVDFLDSSIISNANMISNFIVPASNDEPVEQLDDIFDF